jgi:hypothetical protein
VLEKCSRIARARRELRWALVRPGSIDGPIGSTASHTSQMRWRASCGERMRHYLPRKAAPTQRESAAGRQ